MIKFKLGDCVKWKSQAQGYTKEKIGRVVQVVKAGFYPYRDSFPQLYRRYGVGLCRDYESYVVMVGHTPYWPRVKHLQPCDEGRD